MKKTIVLIALLALLTGCSNSNLGGNNTDNINNTENNIENGEVVNEEQEEVITEYNGLGRVYTSSKNILDLNADDIIYNNRGENPYVFGEYMEVDFACDLITQYLIGNGEVYNNVIDIYNEGTDITLISENEKNRLIDSTNFLREQMGIGEGEPIYYKLDEVVYNGQLEDGGISLEIRGFISAYEGYFASISTFNVTVYKVGDTLYGIIS